MEQIRDKKMNIGLIDVDGHNFPNYALMKVSAFYKSQGASVEWASQLFGEYDRVFASKIFTFTHDYNYLGINTKELIKGGTGYNISSKLPEEINNFKLLDYSIYPQYQFSIQFFSRGCIRKCPFCLVPEKEGKIHNTPPLNLNPQGKWIEVLDNNFFANPEWKSAIDYLIRTNQQVNLRGVDIRILNEEQAYWINKLRLKSHINFAWDLPEIDLSEKFETAIKYIKPSKMMCYILVGFNSTIEQDLYRIEKCRRFGIRPFVMPYRDFDNMTKPSQYMKDIARYVNNKALFNSCKFEDYKPRKYFKCSEYLR